MIRLIEVKKNAVLFKRWYYIEKEGEPRKEIRKEISNAIFNSMVLTHSERVQTSEATTTTMYMKEKTNVS